MNRLVAAAGLAALLIVLVVVVTVGNGDGDDGSAPAGGELDDTSSKPAVEVPDGDPPQELVVEDIVEGDGPRAAAGDQVRVHYVGVEHASGEEFEASWDQGEPIGFELGGGQVIEGWDQGVEGMRVGGRRRLVIPPDLAYGPQGSPPAIGPDATLVFVVDLLEVG